MENEHELSYETLTRVYLGSYEHYKGVVAEVEHSKPGFELQGSKMVETGQNRDFRLRTARVTTPGLRKGPLRLKVCLKSEMGHVYKLGRDVEKLVDVVYKLGSSFGEVFGIGKRLADVVPEYYIIHLIGEKFVALFHLELEMNYVMMKHFDDFECRAFQIFGSAFVDFRAEGLEVLVVI
ncbi:hypothetical protein Tco_0520683 [Tanacetum coccineum]